MKNEKDIRFFPIFLGATVGVILEIIIDIVEIVLIMEK